MSTTGPLPLQPWTCPHCKAVWHSGRQYCIDCGYGMAPTPPLPLAPNGAMERPGVAELRAQFDDLFKQAQLAQGRVGEAILGDTGDTPGEPESQPVGPQWEETRQLQLALSRSMAAESALQAELAPLRERVGQLEQQLREQRTQLVAGVQGMLAPLVAYLEQHCGVKASLTQVIPQAIGVLEDCSRALKSRRRQQEVTPAVVQQLVQDMARLHAQVQSLSQPETRNPEPETAPEGGYGTWVTTDRGAYDLEQALLREQTQRGGLAYGG